MSKDLLKPPRDVSDPILLSDFCANVSRQIKNLNRVAAAQADSSAVDVAGIVADFNSLLAKLRTAGLLDT